MTDHGNAPTIGHPHHPREYISLMVHGATRRPDPFPQRDTFADVGATAADYFHAPTPERGASFLPYF